MTAKNFIGITTGALVLFLAGSAFVLSYDALYRLALDNGVTSTLAFLWPLSLDAVMIAASLTVLRQSLDSERAWYAWLLVGTFTAASITFNVIHAADTWLSRAVFAMPPLVVFLSFELLVSQIRSAIKRAGAAQNLTVLQDAIASASREVSELESQADDLSRQVESLSAERARLESEPVSFAANEPAVSLELANSARQAQKAERQKRVVALVAGTPGVSYSALAETLSVSRATVARDVAHLLAAGELVRNGNGLEVV